MITRRTVIVLGAGASVPYGFPTGPALCDEIATALQDPRAGLALALAAATGDHPRVLEFGRLLRESRKYSVDAFVEGRPDFLDVAKAACAARLLPLEVAGNLRAPGGDWYRYLFNRMMRSTPEDFLQNQLSVVTFNFDRSFERAAFDAALASYPINKEKAGALVRHLGVSHVHGSLGGCPWLGESGIEYGNANPSEQAIQKAASSIRLVHETTEDNDLIRAQFRRAEVVCFLGFGYHQFAMRKLPLELVKGKLIFGTTLGIAGGEKMPIQKELRELDPNVRLHNGDVLTFLRDTHAIHM
jgi:hypothetical protein